MFLQNNHVKNFLKIKSDPELARDKNGKLHLQTVVTQSGGNNSMMEFRPLSFSEARKAVNGHFKKVKDNVKQSNVVEARKTETKVDKKQLPAETIKIESKVNKKQSSDDQTTPVISLKAVDELFKKLGSDSGVTKTKSESKPLKSGTKATKPKPKSNSNSNPNANKYSKPSKPAQVQNQTTKVVVKKNKQNHKKQ
jgi:hypothetical protein